MMLSQAVVALSLLALLSPVVASAQTPTKAGVVTTLEGNVTAARSAMPQPVVLKFKDDVFINDRVVTGDRSLARMLLGGKAVVTVRERSALTITEVPGLSTIELDSGKIAVAVAKEKMRSGERIEVKTPNAVAAVRGTVFVIEVVRASASASAAQPGVTTNLYTMKDQVDLTVGSQTFNVTANTFASATGLGVNTGPMTPQMRAGALGGLTPTGTQPVGGASDAAKDAAMGTTVSTFATATGLAPLTPPPAPPVLPLQSLTPPITPGNTCLSPTDPGCPTTLVVSQLGTGGAPVPPPPVEPPPPLPPTKATGILLFGERVSAREALETDLMALQPNAFLMNLNGTSLPADLSAFGTIWHVGPFAPLSVTDQARLRDFLAAGGGIYLTGERSCCNVLNASIQTLLRSVVDAGATIVVRSKRDFFVPATFNPGARGGITTSPNVLTTWRPNGPGEIFGISGANILATIGEAIVAGVWGEQDLVGNAGRIVLMMDVDWLSNVVPGPCDLACRRAIIENLLTFIDDPAAPLMLAGPLFRSVGEQLSTSKSFFDLSRLTLTTTGLDPLIWLSDETRLVTLGDFSRLADSTVTTAGTYLRLESGATLIQTASTPLMSVFGGSLSVGTGSNGGHIFELIGRAGETLVDSDTGLTIGKDRPIQPGLGATVLDIDGAANVVAGSGVYKVDTALLEATAPLLNVRGGGTVSTDGHVIDLTGRAMVALPNDAVSMVSLNASSLTVRSGHLVNVAGGSILNVAGNLVSLANASTLNILNGLLLNVSGGSSASIGRSLVSFSGAGNVLNITNSIVPTAIVGGIPVSGPIDSFRIGANALSGLGANGAININGVSLTPTTPLSSLTGSLIAIQNGGSVKVGAQ
jgi:FecR protein